MAIRYQVLGKPENDNALLVEVDSGQKILRLLFDCGDQCLTKVPFGQIQQIDHVFFSHFHMDHISGFDALFRCVYAREKPVHFWGPENSSSILGKRFQGFWWNLVADLRGTVWVHSASSTRIVDHRFELSESFAVAHEESSRDWDEVIFDNELVSIRAIQLEHQGPSLGYRVDEKQKQNVSVEAIKELGLTPGPWINELKERKSGSIDIAGSFYEIEMLRETLLTESVGNSIAYLTDFILDGPAENRLIPFLRGCETVIIEAQYSKDDLVLARKNHHTTTDQVSNLAAKAGVNELVLFHLSERYSVEQWQEMLNQANCNFSNTHFPDHWF